MPGFELVNEEEVEAVASVVRSKIFFRHGFDNIRAQFAVENFENDISNELWGRLKDDGPDGD